MQVLTPLVVLAAVVLTLTGASLWWWHRRRHNRKEGLFPLIFGAATLGLTGAKFMGLDKKAQEAAAGKGNAKYQPTYAGREWNGWTWSCPFHTIETGSTDNSKACITSQFHPPAWRSENGKDWNHSCPWGTVPTGEEEWEKKCEVGFMGRQDIDGKGTWKCPWGTEDTGKNWDNAPWREAQKQCKRTRPFTTRIQQKDGKWVCPAGSKDTGKSWGQPNEWDQCQWTGP